MMLSRTASNLYWIGRYVERAEFIARLVEATIRLDSLSAQPAGEGAWASALTVVTGESGFAVTGDSMTPQHVSRYLMLDEANPASIRSCIAAARNNARAARDAITREVWETINRAWLNLKDRTSPGGAQATLKLAEDVKHEARGFEGAIARMLRSEAFYFVQLGALVERADTTARLLDVKYHLILPEGERVGGDLDRDQWMTLLQVAAARIAYRVLYPEGLKPWLIADMLIFEQKMPRSLIACALETVVMLNAIAGVVGKQGPADRLARKRLAQLERLDIDAVFGSGLHQFLTQSSIDIAALDEAIAAQFRFT